MLAVAWRRYLGSPGCSSLRAIFRACGITCCRAALRIALLRAGANGMRAVLRLGLCASDITAPGRAAFRYRAGARMDGRQHRGLVMPGRAFVFYLRFRRQLTKAPRRFSCSANLFSCGAGISAE